MLNVMCFLLRLMGSFSRAQSYEVDPSKLHKGESLQRNQERLWDLFMYVYAGLLANHVLH